MGGNYNISTCTPFSSEKWTIYELRRKRTCPMHISLSEIFFSRIEIGHGNSRFLASLVVTIFAQNDEELQPRPFTLFTPIYVAFLLRSVALMIWGHLYDSESLSMHFCSKFLLLSKKIFLKRKCIPISFQNSQ